MLVKYVLQHMKRLMQVKDKSHCYPGSRLPPLGQTSTEDLCLGSKIQTTLIAHNGDFSYFLLSS